MEQKTERLGEETMARVERAVILRAVDTWWVRHLTALDELRTGIGLRAFGQQDPLVTFKKEAFAMFDGLKVNIQEEIVRGAFLAEPAQAPEAARNTNLDKARAMRGRLIDQARQSTQATPEPAHAQSLPGRNDPCYCGSGKKYKHCHLKIDRRKQRQEAVS
jgi:preprotein translocase subunit SecA